MALRVGVDVGGTFTDIVVFDEESGALRYSKVLTSPTRPWTGVLSAIDSVGVSVSHVGVLVHATTLGANMLLGQAGLRRPEVLLVTNEGFEDVIELGRQNRPELYNPFFEKPSPLVPRSRRVGVRGRIGFNGVIVEDLDLASVRRIAREWCGRVDAFAVSFLHSYANPVHEVEAKRAILEECPGALVVASHEVDRQPKEYERTSTTVVNALLKPMLSRYLKGLRGSLESRGFTGLLLLMQSNGGVAGVDEAMRVPAAFIESGPAAGAVAVAYYSRLLGIPRALGFDMGGTTAKASSIMDGEPAIVGEYEVGARIHMGRPLRGSGYPVRHPFIDLAEVSSGGGTIAWVDSGGALRVGPISAGADPGPACYGRGGDKPTVTDANLLLGRLPEKLAGGGIRLHRDLAVRAVSRLADELGADVVEAASSIIRIANTIMSRALRLVSIERGHDPREFTLFSFGGAGPLHAVDLAKELRVREVIVPPMPGVFSALGLLLADYRHDYHRAIMVEAGSLARERLDKVFAEMEYEAYKALLSEGVPPGGIRMVRALDMRYRGQAHDLTVPYNGDIEYSVEAFREAHRRRYGHELPGEDIIVSTARLTAYGAVGKPRPPRGPLRRHEPAPHAGRSVYFEGEGWVEAAVYDGRALRPGAESTGPAIIESPDSTILVHPDCSFAVDEYYNVRISCSG